MILEAFYYLVTPCPDFVRRMGFLRESISITSRFSRRKSVWQNHLENSKTTILKAIELTETKRCAVIFGAGLGYDLPLLELERNFQRVLLVDVVHSLAIRVSAWRRKKIELISHDITESLLSIFQGKTRVSEPQRFLSDTSIDLVVSLNILSQIPFIPEQYLEQTKRLDPKVVDNIGRGLVCAHLKYLQKFKGTVCLIADIERQVFDVNGHLISTVSALRDLNLPWKGNTWLWDIAPLGELSSEYSVQNRVIGIPKMINFGFWCIS